MVMMRVQNLREGAEWEEKMEEVSETMTGDEITDTYGEGFENPAAYITTQAEGDNFVTTHPLIGMPVSIGAYMDSHGINPTDPTVVLNIIEYDVYAELEGLDDDDNEESEEEDKFNDDPVIITDGKDDKNDKDKASSSTDTMLYDPKLDKEFMAFFEGMSEDELRKWLEKNTLDLTKLHSRIVFVKKHLKGIEKEASKAKTIQAKKDKLATEKEARRVSREQEVALNFRLPSGEVKSISIKKSETIGTLRSMIAVKMGIVKSKATLLRLVHGSDTISERPRMSVGGAKLADGAILDIMVSGRGGAPSLKKAILKKKKALTSVTKSDADTFNRGFASAVSVCGFEVIRIPEMIESMETQTLTELKQYLTHNKSNVEAKLNNIAKYAKEMKQMTAVTGKIEYACAHFREVMFNSLLSHYGKDDGTIKLSDMVSDINVALAVREKSGKSEDAKMAD